VGEGGKWRSEGREGGWIKTANGKAEGGKGEWKTT